jgi:hypothetical protein
MKRCMTRALALLLALAALALVAGCGGTTQESLLTVDDLAGVIGPVPDTPAGASYQATGEPTELGMADLRARATNASDRATVALLEKARFLYLYQRGFQGAINTADGTAYLFKDAAGASDAFAGLRTKLKRQATPARKLTEVGADGLGDEAWGAHLTGGSEAGLYVFRTSNLVVVTDMSCDGSCGLDIVAATRAYADAIAGRASEVKH